MEIYFSILFSHLYQTNTFRDNLNDGKKISSQLMFELHIKQLFCDKDSLTKHIMRKKHFVIAKFKKLKILK